MGRYYVWFYSKKEECWCKMETWDGKPMTELDARSACLMGYPRNLCCILNMAHDPNNLPEGYKPRMFWGAQGPFALIGIWEEKNAFPNEIEEEADGN